MFGYFFFVMIRLPPRSKRTDTLFPYTTLFRSGVARLPKNIVDGLWEQHDQGDEILVVIAGNFTFRLQLPDGQIAERDAAAGDMVVVPKGYPHSFRVHSEELQILFVTPKDGNHGWSERGGIGRAACRARVCQYV